MTPEEEEAEVLRAQAAVVQAAWAFVGAYWVDHDMDEAWPLVDPLFRKCWAQSWLYPNKEKVRADGFDPDDVVAAFAEDEPDHEVWEPFVYGQVEAARQLPVDRETWGVKVNPVPLVPGVELVRLLPVPRDGVIHPGELYASVPLLMRYEDGPGWRVLNFVSEAVPVPGWPPVLGN